MATEKGKALIESAHDRAVDVRHDFLLALRRIEEGKAERVKVRPRQKITPALVAKEASRARSQLYATHRDVLERINEINLKRHPKESNEKKAQKKTELELRELIAQLAREKELLAQHNYRLQRKVEELEADAESSRKVRSISPNARRKRKE